MTHPSTERPGQKSGTAEPAAGQGDVMGIDVGLDGAVAALRPDGTLRMHPTPTLSAGSGSKREFDVAAMKGLLSERPVSLAVVEAVGARPGQGVTRTSRFGYGFGLWVGLLSALGIPFQLVTPQSWKKSILHGTAKDKTAAIQFVQRRFPGVSLLATPRARVPHDGMAEAACLAELGRRLLGGSGPGRDDRATAAPGSTAGDAPATHPGPDNPGPSAPEARP